MFYELVATLFAGLAMAGIVMALNHLTRGRLPKWAMPVGAGLAMIAATIANEYSWYGRTIETLPDGLEVIVENENRVAYRPWTYVVPYVDRFVALDTHSVRTHPDQPALRMVDTLFMGRWAAPEKLTVLVDCAGNKRAPLMDAIRFGDGGAIEGADWVASSADDPLIKATCKKGS